MDRYSSIRGTVASGAEMRLAESEGMAHFLEGIGALDSGRVVNIVETQLRGFEKLVGYDAEPLDLKPVALRYAPMHLYRNKGMERIRPFCALCANGLENREDRVSVYSQTFVFSHQQMRLGQDGYNYLDIIFGSDLLSWKELEYFRNGQAILDCDALPRKVEPQIGFQDLPLILKTVEAIYRGKNVAIRLEQGFNFNTRAVSLLTVIYSLIQPRLAVEVGFAAYQRPADIAKITEKNSIRIFMLPAGESLEQVPEDFLVLDLSSGKTPVRVQKTELTETLVTWAGIPWKDRQPMMQKLFEEEKDYQNAELFVRKSKALFQALKELEAWKKDTSKDGTISSIEALYAEFESRVAPGSPSHEQVFREKISRLLSKESSLDALNAQTAAKLFSTTGEEQQQARKMYLFGRKFGNVDIGSLCQLVSEQQRNTDRQENAVLLSQERANTQKAVADGIAAVALEKVKTQKALEDGRTAVAEAEAKAAKALAEEKVNTQNAIEAGKTAVAEAEAKAAKALAEEKVNTQNAIEAGKTAVALERAKTQKAIDDGLAAVADEKAKTEAVLREKEEIRKQAQAALAEEKRQTQAAEMTLSAELVLRQQAEEKAHQQAEEKEVLRHELENQQAKTEQIKRVLVKAQRDLETVRVNLSAAEKTRDQAQAETQNWRNKYEHAQRELNAYKRGKKTKQLIAIGCVSGFLAAAVLGGAIWLIASILGRNAPQPDFISTVPTETVVQTVPTMPAVLETTQAPVAETEELETDMLSDEEILHQLKQQIPTLGFVGTENLSLWLPDNLSLGSGDEVLAVLSTEAALPEAQFEDAAFSHALLIRHTTANQGPASELESLEFGIDLAAMQADMALHTALYDLIVYGNNAMQYTAMQALGWLIPDDMDVTIQWCTGDHQVNLGRLASSALGNSQWWRSMDVFSEYDSTGETNAISQLTGMEPVVCIHCNQRWIYIFDCTERPELVDALIALTVDGTYRVIVQEGFASLVPTP